MQRPRNIFAHVKRVRPIIKFGVALGDGYRHFLKSGFVGGNYLLNQMSADFHANFFGHVIDGRRAKCSLAAENPREQRET